jgi:hypothetical protein
MRKKTNDLPIVQTTMDEGGGHAGQRDGVTRELERTFPRSAANQIAVGSKG